MGEKICVALNTSDDVYLVSSIYPVFEIIDMNLIVPEYLMMWLKRSEFDRYVRFNSWGSAREVFNFTDMAEIRIPIPDKNTQDAIVAIYKAYLKRIEINEKLKAQIKDICPVLIQGALQEGRKEEP
jgi:type I restriction enzyme S subunit